MAHDTIDEILNKSPPVAFSLYTHIQVQTLKQLAARIVATMDASIHQSLVDARFHEVYGEFWLWVLGAYEVVRTMTDEPTRAPNCFSGALNERLRVLKDKLAKIRIPFAKQVLKGRPKKPRIVSNEPSWATIDQAKKDAAFKIGTDIFWVRELMRDFDTVFDSITRSDVLRDLRDGAGAV